MKKLIISIAFCFLVLGIKAQNLVPNYSFENKIQCPPSDTYFNGYVKNWTGGGVALLFYVFVLRTRL